MSKTNNVVGISNKEIFIKSKYGFHVLRPVEKDVLEELRTVEGQINYGADDLWREAVQAGITTDGLDDWMETYMSESFDETDEEDFPCKDNSSCDELSEEDRELADKYLLEEYNLEVGTWECSGSFSPNSFNKNFKKFDLVLNPKLAKEYYKTL